MSESDVAAGILPRLRTIVDEAPDAIAIADDSTELTYAELAAQAATTLSVLRRALDSLEPPLTPKGAAEFGSGEVVGMLFGHTTQAVVALLAVLASGHPVLVLDHRTPPARLRQFVERAGMRVLLADKARQPMARELCRPVIVPPRDVRRTSADELWANMPDPTSVAALAFTSGSTGTPKPVANDHRLFVRDAWNSSIASGCYGADDVIAHTLPIAFHAGLTTTVHGLLVGATMRLYDARERGIEPLPGFIAEHACSVMITSPGILRGFIASGPDPDLLTSLTSLTIAGETAYGRDVEAARKILPENCVLRNRYGSSETGLIAEYVIDNAHGELVGQLPVGRGVGRTECTVVDAEGNPAAPGVTGRLEVRAPNLAMGYWGLPEITAESFTQTAEGTCAYRTSDLGRMDAAGNVTIVGRADHSVKIRGYLVDPGEIDAALFALPQVREAVVVGAKHPLDDRNRLIAYVVPRRTGTDADAIRSALRTALPTHMIPEAVVFLTSIPRNDRGKIDRHSLPEPPPPAPVGGVGDVSEWEEIVAHHWAEVLRVERVGLEDDFFALGGDSLTAEAIVTRMIEDLGVSPEVARTATLAEHRTLRAFARSLQGHPGKPRTALVTLRATGSKTPLFCVAGGGGLGIAFQPLTARIDADRPVYALQSPVIESRGLPEISVRQMARRHVAVMRSVQPHGPYNLAGHSFGGIVAVEMAQQLQEAGEQVAHFIVLDSFPPDPKQHPPLEPSLIRGLRMIAAVVWTATRNTSGGIGAYRFWEQSRWLGHCYHGRSWGGKTLVLVADSPQREERSAWDGCLHGQWRKVDVGGDHITMLRQPFVDEVAEHVNTFLASDEVPTETDQSAAGSDDTDQSPQVLR
ncbi:non-ribosomal peptide synthetase [Gephyromycinifex aptenodytis]|uniref:non-ribosomal peptide synthetase n=1 Tax=Gephyromycinifex aptenodytis TaxID=2716227 RepID=UPI0014475712|nr:non-ribosomal peptide synthetase [Gephyromycinifex aptenodytis]